MKSFLHKVEEPNRQGRQEVTIWRECAYLRTAFTFAHLINRLLFFFAFSVNVKVTLKMAHTFESNLITDEENICSVKAILCCSLDLICSLRVTDVKLRR